MRYRAFNSYANKKDTLFHNDILWVKHSGNKEFDMPVGSYDGAKVCKLVRVFLLNRLSHVIDKYFLGLHRDVSLGVLRNYSSPMSGRKNK